MPLIGEYEPSPQKWVRDQVERYEGTGGREANTLRDTGLPVVIFTTRGRKSGKIRKTPLMRVEHDGAYAMVASQGGSPKHPVWYHNLKADPEASTSRTGPSPSTPGLGSCRGRSARSGGNGRWPPTRTYAEYQRKTERLIPVFLAERRSLTDAGAEWPA